MRYSHGGDIYTYGEVVDFSVNVNPLGMSEHVAEAAKRGIEKAGAYPDCQCRELRKKLARRQGLPEAYYVFGNGAAEIFYTLVLAEKPKQALLPVPAFSEYERALNTVGCRIKYYETERADSFCIDERFLSELNKETDIVFLCSPGNPSGAVIDRGLLLKVIRLCEKFQIRLVVDECFAGLLEEPEKHSVMNETARCPYLTVVRAFTKTFAMPGLRLGYGITSDAGLTEKMEQMRQPWSVSIPAQEAGIAALDEETRVREAGRLISEERSFLEEQMQRLGIEYVPSDANYILMHSGIDLFRELKKHNILIRDCSDYRGLEKGWYRTAVRGRRENQILIQALEKIIKEAGR